MLFKKGRKKKLSFLLSFLSASTTSIVTRLWVDSRFFLSLSPLFSRFFFLDAAEWESYWDAWPGCCWATFSSCLPPPLQLCCFSYICVGYIAAGKLASLFIFLPLSIFNIAVLSSLYWALLTFLLLFFPLRLLQRRSWRTRPTPASTDACRSRAVTYPSLRLQELPITGSGTDVSSVTILLFFFPSSLRWWPSSKQFSTITGFTHQLHVCVCVSIHHGPRFLKNKFFFCVASSIVSLWFFFSLSFSQFPQKKSSFFCLVKNFIFPPVERKRDKCVRRACVNVF